MSITALFHDYESTGVKPAELGVVSAAYIVAEFQEDGSYESLYSRDFVTHPGMPIPEVTSKIHGLYDEDVIGAPEWTGAVSAELKHLFSRYPITAIGGYNTISFDNKIAARCGLPDNLLQLDLYGVTRRMKTAGLIEKANLSAAYLALTRKTLTDAHNAMADVVATLQLIKPAMEFAGVDTVSELITWISRPFPSPATKMPFGKHKGCAIRDLPGSYLVWARDNCNLDGDLKASIEFALRKGLHK